MRPVRCFAVAFAFASLSLAVGGCAESHGGRSDADASIATDAGGGCAGPRPGDTCACVGGEWRCERMACPPDLNPWDPRDPRGACGVEGAECSSGGPDACGSAMFCTCTRGRWSCAVAEPDPVCWCGREPSEGDRCSEEGATCGECCPTPGGTGWAPMQCVGGHWTAAGCPAIVCPPVEASRCPADTAAALGDPCAPEGASCGHACCDDAIVCEGGAWRPGPVADCAYCPAFECGDGACHGAQLCHHGCGPDDGPVFTCDPLPDDCESCDCVPLWGTQRCETIDGHPHVYDLCG